MSICLACVYENFDPESNGDAQYRLNSKSVFGKKYFYIISNQLIRIINLCAFIY